MYDPQDSRGVPVSTGIPMIVRVTALIGIAVIFCIAGLVIYASPFGHSWPNTAATEIKL
ncbi:MAG: hypothetical protein GIW95_10945 [Candidatus Eremiobacteraeota bacterium]|nr:hypothetical protein [Candidatus Eremiobacteraeota bacterium]